MPYLVRCARTDAVFRGCDVVNPGVPIQTVDPNGQAHGKLQAGDSVISINGTSCRGLDMRATAGLAAKSTTVRATCVHCSHGPCAG